MPCRTVQNRSGSSSRKRRRSWWRWRQRRLGRQRRSKSRFNSWRCLRILLKNRYLKEIRIQAAGLPDTKEDMNTTEYQCHYSNNLRIHCNLDRLDIAVHCLEDNLAVVLDRMDSTDLVRLWKVGAVQWKISEETAGKLAPAFLVVDAASSSSKKEGEKKEDLTETMRRPFVLQFSK